MSITRLTSSPSYTLYQKSPRLGPSGVLVQPPVFIFDHYVSPTGLSTNNGDIGHPWPLQYALNGAGGAIIPGDRIAIRGGAYSGSFSSTVNGTIFNPITFQQYPTERATIDGRLLIIGSWVIMRGFEVMSSNPLGNEFAGIYQQSPFSKLVNLVIHDTAASGILTNPDSPGAEVHGCIVYNCGKHFNQDHGIYVTNTGAVKTVSDNIIFNNQKYGIQLNSPVAGELNHIYLDGNICFSNGSISNPAVISAGIILGAGTGNAQDNQLTNNMTYEVPGSLNFAANVGIININNDIIVTGNYFVGFVEFSGWTTITVSNNTFIWSGNLLSTTPPLAGWTWTNNIHYRDPNSDSWGTTDLHSFTTFAAWKAATGFGATDTNPASAPSGTKVFVRANKYEAGRANVAVYNWDHLASVDVDLSLVLAVGQQFYIVNAQDFYNPTPVVSGTFSGNPVTIPMGQVPAPVPVSGAPAGPVTGPEFQVFVVRLKGN